MPGRKHIGGIGFPGIGLAFVGAGIAGAASKEGVVSAFASALRSRAPWTH
jgi:hypothetical protein